MGKRKKAASKPQGPKKKEPLQTSFQCLFCNHENSVSVKLHKKEGFGQLDCRICGQTYQTGITPLSAAVDVYSEWIDACEAVADRPGADIESGAAEVSRRVQAGGPRREAMPRPGEDEDDDLDGFIENDEGDAEGAYTGTAA